MKRLLMLGSGSSTSTLSIRLLALARHLGRDWRITMILPSADKYNHFTPNPRAKVAGAHLVQPWQLTTNSPLVNLIPYLFTSLVAVLRARADVVWLYKPTPITIIGLLPRLLTHARIVLDMDDLGSEVMKREGQSKLMYGLVALCERLAMRWAHAVVVASTSLEAAVRQKYPTKPVLVLPNGVEPDEYQPVKKQALRPHIYYFGAVNSLDLIESILRATPAIVRAVPDAKITIVGGGSALDDARTLAKKLRIAESVDFTGWVNMLDAQRYTQYGDIAICYQPDTATVRAASNMKVFQYMAMRSAVVVSDVGDLHTYARDGRAGVIVQPAHTKSLAKAVIKLLQDDTARAALADAGYKLAQGEYAWKARAALADEFLRTHIGLRKGRL